MSVDAVDITIVGIILFWIGFAVGIVISAEKPDKTKMPEDVPHSWNMAKADANELVEKFLPLVDSRLDTEKGYIFSRDKKVANAKECALIVISEVRRKFKVYAADTGLSMESNLAYIDKVRHCIEKYK